MQDLIKKHSEFISYPISLWVEQTTEKEVDDDEEEESSAPKEDEEEGKIEEVPSPSVSLPRASWQTLHARGAPLRPTLLSHPWTKAASKAALMPLGVLALHQVAESSAPAALLLTRDILRTGSVQSLMSQAPEHIPIS